MIVFLTLVYCGILYALVKVGVIELTLFWKLSPILWMLLLLVVLFIPMQWGAPAGPVNVYQSVVEIVPNVSGQVVDVPIIGMEPLEQGDVLFQIDPKPFQDVVNNKKSSLEEAKQSVLQLEATAEADEAFVLKIEQQIDILKTDQENAANQIVVAEAVVYEAKANKAKAESLAKDLAFQVTTAQQELERRQGLRSSGAVSQTEVDAAQLQVTGLEAQRNTATIDIVAKDATIKKSEADLAVAKTNARSIDLQMKQLIEADLPRAQANAKRSRLAADAKIGAQHTLVATAEADLRRAEFDLDQTTVRAPNDGYVVGMMLRPGQRAANLPFRSLMSFVNKEATSIVVGVPQYTLRFVESGQQAEVTFKLYPGKTFAATVARIAHVSAPGQLMPSGTLPDAPAQESAAAFGVVLELAEGQAIDFSRIPGGVSGTAAIYTEKMKPTHLIRKVMLRMDAWMNYVIP